MYIELTKITEQGIDINVLTHENDFFACGGLLGSKEISIFTVKEKPLKGGAKARIKTGVMWGFGATTYEEILERIEKDKLIFKT